MAPLTRSLAVAAAALSLVTAALTSGEQFVFGGDEYRSMPTTKGGDGRPFNPMDHMSGISPYHDAPGASLTPPKGCKVSAIALLMRHSCIHGQ